MGFGQTNPHSNGVNTHSLILKIKPWALYCYLWLFEPNNLLNYSLPLVQLLSN